MSNVEEVMKVDEGLYVLREGECPLSLSGKLYGSRMHHQRLRDANPTSEWLEGDTIKVPGKKGRVTVYTDETTDLLIRRMFPGHPVYIHKPLLFKWNPDPMQGDAVFVPER